MSITTEQIQALTGKVYSQNSEKVGSIGQIYLDDSSGAPSWVTVKTGLFGTSESFVPLEGARADGDDLYVDFTEDKIKDAPRVESDGSISPQEEDQLYAYYGLGGGGDSSNRDNERRTDVTDGSQRTDRDNAGGRDGDNAVAGGPRTNQAVGTDTSGPTTDDAMTRSEERVNVGTDTREVGKARLRKYVTTENVTTTVPVRREEVRVEREPITGANADAAGSGPDISEEEHEVVLHEEVPVVDKDVVAVERVGLGKETVTDEATVSEDVRKENVDLVDDDDVTSRSDDSRTR